MPHIGFALIAFALIHVGWQTQVGGRQPLDTSAEEVRVVAEFAATKLSDMSNTMFHKKLATVVTAERQVVSGMNYFITLELAATNCKKNEVERSDLANCVEKEIETCDVVVWDQPWLQKTQLTSFSCQPKPSARDLYSDTNSSHDPHSTQAKLSALLMLAIQLVMLSGML